MPRSKGWSRVARRVARRFGGVLNAMAKRPDEHLAAIFGTSEIGPDAVTRALESAETRSELNLVLGWAWDWRSRLVTRADLWPTSNVSMLWDGIWECYERQFRAVRGQGKPLTRTRRGRKAD